MGGRRGLRADPWRLRLCRGIRHRAQVSRDPALPGGADLDQPDPVLSGRARARAAALLLAHVSAKWPPVRRKGHAPTHEIRARPDSAGTGRALMSAPLSGILVVALEQAVAAPMCTCRLTDAGARVIKIERPEGDFARGYDSLVHGESAYFVWLNRGKESVVLDLARPHDKALLEAMIARADVFVQNLKPGAVGRLGFAIDRLRGAYPRLIACSISGYGESGPYAQRKAYDLLIQAESGLASVTGGPEAPARVGVSVVDVATGMNAYGGILEARIGRERTGQGTEISVSMFDAMADWMTVPLLHHEGGKTPTRLGLAHPAISPYGVFKTRDGDDGLISMQNDSLWG